MKIALNSDNNGVSMLFDRFVCRDIFEKNFKKQIVICNDKPQSCVNGETVSPWLGLTHRKMSIWPIRPFLTTKIPTRFLIKRN